MSGPTGQLGHLGHLGKAGKVGRVALVGAGPGDPELLTLRALRRLQDADVILYDALVDRRVLELVPRARCVDVGKRCGGRQVQQRVTERLLVRLARRGWNVVRLKGGDPFVFGRGGEEALALVRAGVPFEVVPGLSSALAGPALCGIPVTHRGTSAAVLIVSGHDLAAARGLLAGLPPEGATLVVLMGRERRGALAELLLQHGWSAATPAAVVQGASLPEQALWRGTPGTLAEPECTASLSEQAASLLVIGRTVGLAEELAPAAPLVKADAVAFGHAS
jgi:uroporphyrin-III C-methyltransferase/precorrin-2 dehydrogenase/sirohydrochlorin ferrochelatase